MSPILTRPIREQLEHDRIIRQLQARYKRKHDVAINPGHEQNESVKVGELAVFPDLLLFSQTRGRKLEGTVEVETGESVNALEALAEWGVYSRLKVPFHLYIPPQSIDTARRLCDDHKFAVAEIWTYHTGMDQVRFTQVYRAPNAPRPAAEPKASPSAGTKTPKTAARPRAVAKLPARPAAKATGKAAAKPAAKTAGTARVTKKPAATRKTTPARAQKAAARPAKPAARKAAAKPASRRAAPARKRR